MCRDWYTLTVRLGERKCEQDITSAITEPPQVILHWINARSAASCSSIGLKHCKFGKRFSNQGGIHWSGCHFTSLSTSDRSNCIEPNWRTKNVLPWNRPTCQTIDRQLAGSKWRCPVTQASQQRVKELDSVIAELSANDPDAQLLMKTPGIALFSWVALSSRIAGIERFKRPRALANYFGLTPGCRNSGEQKDRLGRITKAGSSMTRWVLGQASKHILRTDPAMRAWFKKLKRKRGSKIARVAVMRRMATIIWHMLTKRKTWAEVRSLGIGLQT